MVALALSAVSVPHGPSDSLVAPTGTPIPIRFLTPISSGTTRRGWTVEVQTMADVRAGSCVVVPAYTRVLGIVDESLAGRFFRRAGRLHLTFEDANIGPGKWLPLTAVVEGVEWLPPHDADSTGRLLVRIPRSPLSGKNSSREGFATDGRAAVVRAACGGG
jgi:hypothetical protein